MKLFLDAQLAKLLQNGHINNERRSHGQHEIDFLPVVKLFTPDAGATWLLTEIDPDDQDIAFGLCDLGLGCAELGSVSVSEIVALRGRFGLPVERDRHFEAKGPLSVYAAEAYRTGGINA